MLIRIKDTILNKNNIVKANLNGKEIYVEISSNSLYSSSSFYFDTESEAEEAFKKLEEKQCS